MSNENPTAISDGVVAAIHYTLTLDDGEQVDSSRGNDPLLYLHGHGNIVPGLENALKDRGTGEIFNVKVEPEEGYGPRIADAVQRVPRADLPPEMEPEVGMQIGAEVQDGQMITLHITDVTDEDIEVDPNHPLAGKTLNFAIEVMTLRPASGEELEHGHPHGPGGHDH